MPSDNGIRIDDWTAGLIGKSASEVRNELEKRWDVSESAGHIAFRKWLAGYDLRGITVFDEVPHVMLLKEGEALFVPPPADRQIIRQRLVDTDFENNAQLESFLIAFNGIKESSPEEAGQFMDINEDPRIVTLGDMDSDAMKYDNVWAKSLVLFHALNGDLLCLNPNGSVGWCVMDDAEKIKPFAATFDECLLRIASLRERHRGPFDAYVGSQTND